MELRLSTPGKIAALINWIGGWVDPGKLLEVSQERKMTPQSEEEPRFVKVDLHMQK
jgi:hypothetical protein